MVVGAMTLRWGRSTPWLGAQVGRQTLHHGPGVSSLEAPTGGRYPRRPFRHSTHLCEGIVITLHLCPGDPLLHEVDGRRLVYYLEMA